MPVAPKILFAILVSCPLPCMISGCGNTPLKFYPNFLVQKEKISHATIMADVIVVDELIGDTDKVNVHANREIGDSVLDAFARGLTRKRYPVEGTIFTSVGLMLNKKHIYKLEQTAGDRELPAEDLQTGKPPFYLDDRYARDSALMQT